MPLGESPSRRRNDQGVHLASSRRRAPCAAERAAHVPRLATGSANSPLSASRTNKIPVAKRFVGGAVDDLDVEGHVARTRSAQSATEQLTAGSTACQLDGSLLARARAAGGERSPKSTARVGLASAASTDRAGSHVDRETMRLCRGRATSHNQNVERIAVGAEVLRLGRFRSRRSATVVEGRHVPSLRRLHPLGRCIRT